MTGTAATGTGTVYALVDPRDGRERYIGQTTRTLAERLQGHSGGSTSPRVRSWMAELREAGLGPLITAIRENVPAGDLRAAEHEEITRIIAAGGTLLNEQATARGRELGRRRREADRAAAEQAAWAELAALALSALGGPLPPGDLPGPEIPDVSWNFISNAGPGHSERMNSFMRRRSSPGHGRSASCDAEPCRYAARRSRLPALLRSLLHLDEQAQAVLADELARPPVHDTPALHTARAAESAAAGDVAGPGLAPRGRLGHGSASSLAGGRSRISSSSARSRCSL